MELTVSGTTKIPLVRVVKRSVVIPSSLTIVPVFLSSLSQPISLTISSITVGTTTGKHGWFTLSVFSVISKKDVRV